MALVEQSMFIIILMVKYALFEDEECKDKTINIEIIE